MMTPEEIRMMISAEVEARLSAMGLSGFSQQGLEELALVALEQACAMQPASPRGEDMVVQPLNPSPVGGLNVWLAQCIVTGHGSGKTLVTANIGATTVTLTDDATNYFWAEVDMTRGTRDGSFYFYMADASLVVNTNSSYDSSTNTGELPGSSTGKRVLPLGTITAAGGKVVTADLRLGHIWFTAPECALPEATQYDTDWRNVLLYDHVDEEWKSEDFPPLAEGDMIYKDAARLQRLANPGVVSNDYALIHDGTSPQYLAIQQVTVVTAVRFDESTSQLQVKTNTLDVLRKGTESDWTEAYQASECD